MLIFSSDNFYSWYDEKKENLGPAKNASWEGHVNDEWFFKYRAITENWFELRDEYEDVKKWLKNNMDHQWATCYLRNPYGIWLFDFESAHDAMAFKIRWS